MYVSITIVLVALGNDMIWRKLARLKIQFNVSVIHNILN